MPTLGIIERSSKKTGDESPLLYSVVVKNPTKSLSRAKARKNITGFI